MLYGFDSKFSNIDKLIKAGVEYDCKPIRLTVKSKTRTFNK